MTPRQFAVLQHLSTVGWDLPINISSRVFGAPRTTACNRALSMLKSSGMIEQSTRQFRKIGKHGTLVKLADLSGYQLTAEGEQALVEENLRLLKEIT